ncbi:HAD-IIB family hydrolase [Rhizobium sp. AAP43]|uniref:HAD-IIB family hydrolase n=1 Tax=Rhizobium sp. AAP43 TaxID=1523420 RepID=UPI0009E85071|nr:HAD-IIB family hydrolase [Rhizobium sp. AAP43]
MERWRLKPIRLFSSDLDGTLAGDRQGSEAFARFWADLPAERRPLLVYNSGRLIEDILAFTAEEGLPEADFVIGGVGTMLHSAAEPEIGTHYARALGHGFDVDLIEADLLGMQQISRQPAQYQHALKSSWYLHNAKAEDIMGLEQRLRRAGHPVRIVYSSNRDLDVIPDLADKGRALAWLCQRLGVGLDEVVVAGDTGNDLAMFTLDGVRGILPGNALAELSSLAQVNTRIVQTDGHSAHGVLTGLMQFGIGGYD